MKILLTILLVLFCGSSALAHRQNEPVIHHDLAPSDNECNHQSDRATFTAGLVCVTAADEWSALAGASRDKDGQLYDEIMGAMCRMQAAHAFKMHHFDQQGVSQAVLSFTIMWSILKDDRMDDGTAMVLQHAMSVDVNLYPQAFTVQTPAPQH
jgi:hypothetical protein